jgi:hypothetical protein
LSPRVNLFLNLFVKYLSIVEEKTSFWGRAKFISETDTVIFVEEYALEWYRQNNVFQQTTSQLTGLHDEGAVLLELFGILMNDILFDMTVPDVFIYTFQVIRYNRRVYHKIVKLSLGIVSMSISKKKNVLMYDVFRTHLLIFFQINFIFIEKKKFPIGLKD